MNREAGMVGGNQAMSGSVVKTVDLAANAAEVWAVTGDFNGLPR